MKWEKTYKSTYLSEKFPSGYLAIFSDGGCNTWSNYSGLPSINRIEENK